MLVCEPCVGKAFAVLYSACTIAYHTLFQILKPHPILQCKWPDVLAIGVIIGFISFAET